MAAHTSDFLLGPLGLGEVEEKIYRSLLRWGGGTRENLINTTGLPERNVRAALVSLEEKGLLGRSTRRSQVYVPAPPQTAIDLLILRRQEELERVRLAAQKLTDEAGSESPPSGTPPEIVEVVERGEGVATRNYQLLMGAKREILAFTVPPTEPPDELFTKFKVDVLGRGVRGRVVYTPEMLETTALLTFIEAVRPVGEEPRVAPQLPMSLLIVDRRVGFVPLHLGKSGVTHDHLVVHPSSLLASLVWLFETVWHHATPFEPGAHPAATGSRTDSDTPLLSADEQRVLALLGVGLQDAAIAHQLGIVPRSAQRHVRNIMEILGTKTRFQTGMEACRRGLIAQARPIQGDADDGQLED